MLLNERCMSIPYSCTVTVFGSLATVFKYAYIALVIYYYFGEKTLKKLNIFLLFHLSACYSVV